MNGTDNDLALALEDVASTAVHRRATDVYRFAMSALGHLLLDPGHYRPMAESVLDSCRFALARGIR